MIGFLPRQAQLFLFQQAGRKSAAFTSHGLPLLVLTRPYFIQNGNQLPGSSDLFAKLATSANPPGYETCDRVALSI